jgi:hypothetical protein
MSPAVICVGEATTYLDWLEGTLSISEQDPIEQPADMDDPEDLLNIVRDRGTLIVSTDPNYAPQSFLNPDGSSRASTSTWRPRSPSASASRSSSRRPSGMRSPPATGPSAGTSASAR